MRPRLKTILILLVLGAVVNVGVAWGTWLFGWDWGAAPPMRMLAPPVSRKVVSKHAPEARADDAMGYSEGFGAFIKTRVALSRDDVGRVWTVREFRVGWPIECLRRATVHSTGPTAIGPRILAVTAGGTRQGQRPAGHAPSQPLPLGFTVNTLVYAALLWLLFLGPFTLRRLVRTRRGLCPACAYPVGESSVCTECGGAVRPAS